MSSDNEQNGWNEWSRHVLKELERLNDNYESLRITHEEIKTEVSKISSFRGELDDIKLWKSRIDDVASPAQMKDLINEVDRLKQFKTKSIAIFLTIQFIMGLILWLMNVIG
jgi:predicted  nucleic acid-binding Zn-ribbon protein